jgi:hypothetical protein
LQIADALAKSVRTTLSPEQAARYQKEHELRSAARKRAVLLNLVAKVDRLLILTRDQRGKLSEILENHWNDSWDSMQMLMYGGDQYLPEMPEGKILPILTVTQKDVWRGIQKRNIRFGIDLGILQGIQLEDEIWDEDGPGGSPERRDGKAAAEGKEPTNPVEKK